MPKAAREARHTDDRGGPFLELSGLPWKTWLDGDADRLAGGIYLFADQASAAACAAGPILARIKADRDVADVSIRIPAVRQRMSALTLAPIHFGAPEQYPF